MNAQVFLSHMHCISISGPAMTKKLFCRYSLELLLVCQSLYFSVKWLKTADNAALEDVAEFSSSETLSHL